MTDIVERLRRYAHANSWAKDLHELTEAADEIERLRAALREIADLQYLGKPASTIAKCALELKPLTDIVERLHHSPRQKDECQYHKLTAEAADEIERLRALGPDDDWEERGAAAAMQAKIERLRKENLDSFTTIADLHKRLDHLNSSPTIPEADELIERLCRYPEDDIREAATTIHRLARNQITASSTIVAQAAALQAQRADIFEQRNTQLTDALMKALALQDALLTEISHLGRQVGGPAPLQLMAAKNNFDIAMKQLLGEPKP